MKLIKAMTLFGNTVYIVPDKISSMMLFPASYMDKAKGVIRMVGGETIEVTPTELDEIVKILTKEEKDDR